MYLLLTGSLVALLVCEATAVSAGSDSQEIQHFLDRDWGFECRRSEMGRVVRAVCARHVEEAQAREFLGSLPVLDRLSIEFSTLGPGDIRSLARRCPSLTAVHFTRHREALEAALWPELFEFQRLKHLTVESLRCSGDEKWSIPHSKELETLELAGNLSGMLPALLAPCKVRSLRVEFRGTEQQLTIADHAALGSHTEMESLEILGNVFGSDIVVDLNALSGLKRLRRLTLQQCSVDPLSLHRFPVLEVLSLERCRFIKHDFDALLAHPSLEELVLTECSNESLRIARPYTTTPKNLRAISLRFPVFAEIRTFHSLPCSYDLQLGIGRSCVPKYRAHTLRRLGLDEVTSLEKLEGLRSVSVIGGAGIDTKVSAASLIRLARISTLRRLEVMDADVVHDAPGLNREQDSGLEEVRFETGTPLNREFVTRFLGTSTRRVFLGDFSGESQTATRLDNATHISPKEVGLLQMTLPVSPASLDARLLTSSAERLVLEFCSLNKGAVRQLVNRSPSLKHLTLDMCSLEDERELLHLNDLIDLDSVDFTQTNVSASTARAMKAESVRFGAW